MIPALIDLMSAYHQAGNLPQMAAIARSLVAAIPEDPVALQFLGLALYQMGRVGAARRVFAQVAERLSGSTGARFPTTGELAATTVYRLATSPASGLGEAWRHIAQVLRNLGFRHVAHQADRAARLAGNRGNPFAEGSGLSSKCDS